MRARNVVLGMCLLLFALPAGAQPAKAPAAKTDFKALVVGYWDGWGSGDVARATSSPVESRMKLTGTPVFAV